MAQLEFLTGMDKGRAEDLPAGPVSLGRTTDNSVVINDPLVSRHHARIVEREGIFSICDLGSGNGTFINDAPCVRETLLHNDDLIRLGNTLLLFRAMKSAASNDSVRLQEKDFINRSAEAFPTLSQSKGTDTIAFRLSADTRNPEVNIAGHHLGILFRVAQAFKSNFNTDEFLEALMDALFDTFHPDRGAILLPNPSGDSFDIKAKRIGGEDFEISRTVIHEAIVQREALLIGDIAMDNRFSGAESIVSQRIQSAICAPLVHQENVHGVIYLDARSRPMHYQKEDLALLNIIAANTAVALENARLIREKIDAERLAAMGVAVAGISHYAKNVLMGITGAAGVIDIAIKSEAWDMIKDTWPILKRSSHKMSDLIHDMLSYSKRREPEWAPGNLNDILRDVFENQKDRAQKAGVHLSLDLSASLPESEFDHKSIHDTVLNLAGNAIEACEGMLGGSVSLRSSEDISAHCLTIEIADTGAGITPEIQARIFEPFFSTKGSKGTGLGLAIARKTVEEHGGTLCLESTPGQGSTFRIALPLRKGSPG